MPLIAAAAMAGGALLGFSLCWARHKAGRRKPRSGRTAGHHRKEENGDHGQGADPGGCDPGGLYGGGPGRVLAHRNEPATLTACVFGVCGFENGVMGWIKTTKEKVRDRRWEQEDRERMRKEEQEAAKQWVK